MFWQFSVEHSVFWGYHRDSYARNFMLPLDETKLSAGFNFIFLQFKIILHKSPVTFPLYHRVENSEKIYMYLHKVYKIYMYLYKIYMYLRKVYKIYMYLRKIYMYLYKVLYVSFLCMDSGPHQNINFFPGYSKLHNLNVLLNFIF